MFLLICKICVDSVFAANVSLVWQRKEAIQEINEDIHQLKVAVETLKQYHQDDDEEKDDEAKDAEGKPPDNDAG